VDHHHRWWFSFSIKQYFRPFMEFYFPAVAAEIDFSRPPVFRDKELDRLVPKAKVPGRYADLLVRSHTCSGEPVLLYTHIEVQGRKEAEFARRIFSYTYRIFDATGELPVSLIVLTDSDPAFNPRCFEINSLGRYLRLEFQVVKLIYFKERRAELESSRNPFAFVTLAQLEVNESDRQLTGELEKERGGETMSYVTSWERIARKDGIIEGKIEGKIEDKREVLIRQLDKKFRLAPGEKSRIEASVDPDKLDKALDAILFAETKEEVLRELD
jgi:hypothetical protein